ncbi:hypothetical protein K450DRAFT_249194 [Umbelopsis ramanniana AG]|uniref:RNA polymerase II degradation factor 1 n=1 Tax=Umbelopsis ramanniana AG TaxID=1314678 RepID=A0AAD5HD94_UMBRA|nr:uncharacterized protein K450DRAFT_249194 [Umbelopsis ramanniana AG]KAI8577953.1 hypothetical protein K450DRAFT_249194 [Umbelopsis ramanniana AG]
MAANESSHLPERKKTHPDTDLKKLKSQYGPKLSTLRELFADWSDEDLIFALQEADGDLELTVERISEGWVNQWGEVKTKKAKKESQQKAKTEAAAAATQQQHQQSPSFYSSQQRSEKSDRPPKASERGSRGRDASTRGRPSNIGNRGAPTSNRSTVPSRKFESSSTDASGSWASIASSQKPESQAASSGWDAPVATPSNDISWSDSPAPTTTAPQQPSTIAPSNSESTTTTTASKPSSWASLLKSQPKPEPTKQEAKQPEAAPVQTSEWDKPTTSDWDKPATSEKPAASEWDLPAQSHDLATEESTMVPTVPEPTTVESAVPEPVSASDATKPTELTGVKSKTPIGRRLKQDAPVVMPGGGASLGTMGVKFGSLNLNDEDVNETEEPAPSALQQEEERHAIKEPLGTESAYVNKFANTTASNLTGVQPSLSQETSQALKQEQAPAQQHMQHQQQQQQQQQHFGMDHLNSPYGSYLHNQLPGGFSGFGMNPMGSIPDYGVYGNDAQRAAAMGMYDPSAYGHSPSVTAANAYQGRDKLAQDGPQSANATSAAGQTQTDTLHSQQTQQHQQPGYPNMPYYPYYYMPNQFNAHYGSGFGQPFVNKNMYPMYSGKPNAPSSPYAAGGSPYASQQHLYGLPGANSPYDDMSAGAQQQAPGLGGNGIFDYQKQVYGNPQLQDFLGAQGQTQATPRQAGQAGQTSQTSKADLRGQAQGQQQQTPQQQQYPQQGYYQQQAFSSYGQYTQGQQHSGTQQQPQPQQQQQQQQQPYQPRSQYWNQ